MTDVLIISHQHDLHAQMVKYALNLKGAEAALWAIPEFGETQTATLQIGNNQALTPSLAIEGEFIDLNAVRTIWARRPVFPSIPASANPLDSKQVKQENSLFVQGLWWALSHGKFWVNPYEIRRRIKSKPMQLAMAREAGINIPDTIFGNNALEIRRFIDKHKDGGVIYKPHRISEWEESGKRFLLHTAEIYGEAHSDGEFEICAGIYQEKIPKAYELRIHVFGDFIVAVKIDSQSQAAAKMDWRSAHPSTLKYDVVNLSHELSGKIRQFLRKFGAVFGIIDAIITPSNEFYFLEINEMGQFLWLEAYCPESMLLDHFCSYLLHGSANYAGKTIGTPVSYLELRRTGTFESQFTAVKNRFNQPDYEVEWLDVLV